MVNTDREWFAYFPACQRFQWIYLTLYGHVSYPNQTNIQALDIDNIFASQLPWIIHLQGRQSWGGWGGAFAPLLFTRITFYYVGRYEEEKENEKKSGSPSRVQSQEKFWEIQGSQFPLTIVLRYKWCHKSAIATLNYLLTILIYGANLLYDRICKMPFCSFYEI